MKVNKLRRTREAKALAFLQQRSLTRSALEIGIAALNGEPRACEIPRSAKAAIGLSIAVELVRRRLAKATRENLFKIVRYAKRYP
jgi:hypothetical protein